MEGAQRGVSPFVQLRRLGVAGGKVVLFPVLVAAVHDKIDLFQPGVALDAVVDAGQDGIGHLALRHEGMEPILAVAYDDRGAIGFDSVQQLPGNVPVMLPGGLEYIRVQGPSAGGLQKDGRVGEPHLPQGQEAFLLPGPVVGIQVHQLHGHALFYQRRQQPAEAGQLLSGIPADQHDDGVLLRRLELRQLPGQFSGGIGGKFADGALALEIDHEAADPGLGHGNDLGILNGHVILAGNILFVSVQPGDLYPGGQSVPGDVRIAHIYGGIHAHRLAGHIAHPAVEDAVRQPSGIGTVFFIGEGQHLPHIHRFFLALSHRKHGIGRKQQYREQKYTDPFQSLHVQNIRMGTMR